VNTIVIVASLACLMSVAALYVIDARSPPCVSYNVAEVCWSSVHSSLST
jgi:hypothetical protein